MPTPNIIIISLLRSDERRKLVRKQMQKFDLSYEFLDAIDGLVLDINSEIFDITFCRKNFDHDMNKGEFACANSHILAYETIVKNNYQETIVLEDDFILTADFKLLVDEICDKGPENRELVYLYHGKAKKWPIKKSLLGSYKLAKYRYPSKDSKRLIIGAVAYMLTLSGAKKLLSLAYPIRMPADYLLGTIQLHRLSTYGVEPNCVDIADIASDIDGVKMRLYGGHLDKKI